MADETSPSTGQEKPRMTRRNAIVFLAANLDQGGVADHVKMLAQELNQQGIKSVALDRRGEFTTNIPRQCEQIGAEWIGLHFVSYGWAQNGLLKKQTIADIKTACAGRRLALYLHELWIGESVNDSCKHRLIGWSQRRSLLRLIKVLAPEQVFTSNPVYQTILAHHGVRSDVLPLPGNLPAPTANDECAARQWLTDHRVDPQEAPAVVFGAIHPEWDPRAALMSWADHLSSKNQPATLLTLGRHGPAGTNRLGEIQQSMPKLRIIRAGELAPANLAGLLACASFGLATTPWALIGKSGSAAAYREAGLPVLVTRDDWHWRRGTTPNPIPHSQFWQWSETPVFDWQRFLVARAPRQTTLHSTATAWLALIHSDQSNS
jgi:hypothetical protein